MPIHETLAEHARVRPDAAAVEVHRGAVTFGALYRRAVQMAIVLQDEGIAPGDRVAVQLPDSAALMIVLYGLARAGASALSISPESTAAESEAAVAGLDCAAVIGLAAGRPFAGLRRLDAETLLRRPFDPAAEVGLPVVGDDDPVVALQSSGTTGRPKTLYWSHAQLNGWITRYMAQSGWRPGDRYFPMIALSFPFGRNLGLAALQVGATLVIDPPRSMPGLMAKLRERQITVSHATPTHLRSLLRSKEDGDLALPAFRALFCSTAPSTPEEHSEALARLTPHFFQSYGSNEISTVVVTRPEEFAAHPGAIGRLIPGVEARVVEPVTLDDGQVVPGPTVLPPGEVGLVGFRYDDLPRGYIGNPDADTRHFRDGWFFPGDLAVLSADGWVSLRGRVDDVINTQGAKFYPLDVEAALLSHPAIEEAASFGWPHPELDAVAVAFVKAVGRITAEDLVAHAAERLAPYKMPWRIFFVKEMPKNRLGKILKSQLKEAVAAELSKDMD